MNILIVDDEYLLVQNLDSILSNSNLKIEQIYHAKNVDEAIEIINLHNPDIILSDIRMPNKSGIDLAKYIHEKYPHKPVILITGYSDFEYTQASIQNQVFDYILKPVEANKVISSVSKAFQQLEAYEQHERIYGVFREYFDSNIKVIKKQYIENLLFHRISKPVLNAQKELFNLNFDRYRLIALQCSTSLKHNLLEGEYYCTGLVEQHIQSIFPQAMTYLFGNIVFFIWEVKNTDAFADNARLSELLFEICHYAKENFFGRLSVGISQVSDSLSHIHHLRKQSTECLNHIQDGNKGNVLFYEDIAELKQLQYDIDEDLQQLLSSVRSGRETTTLNCFDEIIQQATKNSEEYLRNSLLLIMSNLSFLSHELKLDSSASPIVNTLVPMLNEGDLEKYIVMLREWIKTICRLVSSQYQQRSSVVIENVKEFIKHNYRDNIGLTEAAQYVGRNSSYVSRLVKEFTGSSFTQLLTDKRIYEAKQLLKNTSLKVSDIAEKIGYPNTRYFNRVFKSNVNMCANDYRKFITTFDNQIR